MKKLLSFVLSLVLSFLLFVQPCFASDFNDSDLEDDTIVCDDGSISIVLAELSSETIICKGLTELKTKTGQKTYTKTISGSVVWTAVLTASFTYDGYTSTCIAANCNVTFSNTSYSLKDKQVILSGNTAIATITIVKKVLGITVSTETLTLTLSCDSAGNLS